MNIWLSALIFLIGVVLVIKGGDWFVDAASYIAEAAHVPAFLIGATIVSFATTLPELIVSVLAAAEGKSDMAVGNAIGSVSANTGLIMAIAMLFMSIVINRKLYLKQCLLLIAAAGVLWIGCMGGSLKMWACALLFVIFVMFMVFSVGDAKKNGASEHTVKTDKKLVLKNIIMFMLGAVCIVLGSDCLIDGGSALALQFGVSERIIAVTMVAVGTSLPELVTTLSAIRKKECTLAVGNIIGANIIDLTLILPLCALVSKSAFIVPAQSLSLDFPVCFAITLIAIVPLIAKGRAYKWQGAAMLAGYAGYLALTTL